MGIQNQLTDFSSDSLPIFLLAIIADGICYLRSALFAILRTFNLISYHRHRPSDDVDDGFLFDAVGSGLAGLILLTEQLNLNRSFPYTCTDRINNTDDSDCVVCLNKLYDGEIVRKLTCRHVFHKECLDGWLDCFNFSCPVCRCKLVSDERVRLTRRRVADDAVDWFACR